jgi:hypothetical protein
MRECDAALAAHYIMDYMHAPAASLLLPYH